MKAERLAVIASPGLSAGFALAGVTVVEATDAIDIVTLIDQLVNDVNAGVILIEETLYRNLADEVRRGLQRSISPVVIPVPGPDWTAESTAHEYIVEILRRAIGYRVRLQ
ncbi:MAG: V-type ATP synthase subunit F [Myxococcales bacterium]|nr:V-type ATP synthase subunit F [Myxococcales bacterium]